jgi:3-oxoacyl-[acyl-carrier protein] reductase
MPENKQTFIIIGGTGSIGSALVRQLSTTGANVVVGARDSEKAEQLADETGCDVHSVEAADPASIEACVKSAAGKHGSITGVANCIGSVLLKPAHLTTDAEWHHTITTNLTSSFSLVRSAAKAMRQSGGSIVLVSSAAAQIGLSNHEAIAAAKAGIIGLTLSAAATYASRGIRVNAVSPGLVKSEMTRKLWETDEAAAMSAQMHAVGRLGEPEDVARAIAWLLDPDNTWVTGQTIGVDGGLGSVLTRMKM